MLKVVLGSFYPQVPSRKKVLQELEEAELVRDEGRPSGTRNGSMEAPIPFLNHALDTEILQ